MKIWENTKTLDGFVDDLTYTDFKENADIALLGSKPIKLEEFPNLKGIFRAGIGRDNVPVKEAGLKGIKVAFPSSETIDFIYEETANFTCYLILKMMYSEIGTLDPWVKNNRLMLNDQKLLIIGRGNIGLRVYKKMKLLIKVKTFDVKEDSLDKLYSLISSADCISLHIPMTSNNTHFFNKEKLSWMKEGAVLINTSRGAIVSEEDLYEEIKKCRIKAAFDVYWQEPYRGKLKKFHPDRFFMTPHVASTCEAFLKGAADDLRSFIKELAND